MLFLGVGRSRLERHGPAGEAAGVARMFGWDRRWRADQLAEWWAARDQRIRELLAGTATRQAVATR